MSSDSEDFITVLFRSAGAIGLRVRSENSGRNG